MGRQLERHTNKNHHFGLQAFLIALVTACVLIIPFIIFDGGVFYYYGDFNVQEIPFYQMVHDAIKIGNLGWNTTTDLGSDLISSYSFYLLGSPFFWLTIPFPSEAVPYLIGPLLILKLSLASLSAYLYLKRYVRHGQFAVIGGLLYAFSGFSIYNIFFFHFHEPMIMFPLLLAALDSFLFDKKRGIFAPAVFCACVVNYYFFTGQVLFVIIYFLMLVFTKTYKFSIKEFLLLAVEVLTGFLASAFILLPSVLGIMGNPRLNTLPNGWDALVHSSPQRYWLSIASFFFPADMPAFPTFTPDSNCKWASVAGWLPLVGMTGAIAYLQLKKRDWIKKIISLLIIMAFVPVLNSAFQMLNSSIYYTRWYYMLVLMLTLATIRAFESHQSDWGRAVRWSTGITLAMTVLIGFMPKITTVTTNDVETDEWSIGIAGDTRRFWIYALIAVVCILGFVLIFKKFGFHTKAFYITTTVTLCFTILLTSGFIIGSGTAYSSTIKPIKENIINKRDTIHIEDLDDDSVRSDFYECPDNTAMFWQIKSINCFQSSVSPSIMEFYDSLGMTRDVASRPETNMYGIRSLLSCKYLFDYMGDDADISKSFTEKDGKTKMPYWKFLKAENGFRIYENTCYIPMGFTYDSFITNEEFDLITNSHKTEAILYSMVLSREQMQKYASVTGYSDKDYKYLYSKTPEKFTSKVNDYYYDKDTYIKICKSHADNSCSEFKYTNNGFTAEFDNTDGNENLLFFSVPYSDGFTAYVNGNKTDIEKVNNGLMAVYIPENTKCSIEFVYETPGLSTGILISVLSAAAFAVYILSIIIFRLIKKRK